MSSKLTAKEVRAIDGCHFRIPYCNAHTLLSRSDCIGHLESAYGWDCDVFDIWHNGKRIIITTGYRRTIGAPIPYELTKQYEDKAFELCRRNWCSPDYAGKLNNLLHEFLDEIVD